MIPDRRFCFALGSQEQTQISSRHASCLAREMAERFLAELRMIFACQSNRQASEAIFSLLRGATSALSGAAWSKVEDALMP